MIGFGFLGTSEAQDLVVTAYWTNSDASTVEAALSVITDPNSPVAAALQVAGTFPYYTFSFESTNINSEQVMIMYGLGDANTYSNTVGDGFVRSVNFSGTADIIEGPTAGDMTSRQVGYEITASRDGDGKVTITLTLADGTTLESNSTGFYDWN